MINFSDVLVLVLCILGFGAIIGLFGWGIYTQNEAKEMCSPFELERSHLDEKPPWVSCTSGRRVWVVQKHREVR